jgi:transposase
MNDPDWRQRVAFQDFVQAGPSDNALTISPRTLLTDLASLTRSHAKAALQAMTVKTDRNDARGMAHLVRMGFFRPVHAKTLPARDIRALLTGRRLLLGKLRDVELGIRGILRGFGLKVGKVGKSQAKFTARIRELMSGHPMLEPMTEAMLAAQVSLRAEYNRLHKQLLAIARDDVVCRRMVTAPGVGAVVAMTYKAAIDDPDRFRKSKDVGPYFGLTPRKYQSGEVDRTGHISKIGDETVRAMLYEAANTILSRVRKFSALKVWAMRIVRARGMKCAKTALARKLAVLLHRMWIDGTTFRWSKASV